jgi:hypothetical protein
MKTNNTTIQYGRKPKKITQRQKKINSELQTYKSFVKTTALKKDIQEEI